MVAFNESGACEPMCVMCQSGNEWPGNRVKRKPRTAGFTLVELFIVVAVVLLLAAILLPAAQHARESARRIECATKLRVLAMALSSYQDAHGAYPATVRPNRNRDALINGQPHKFYSIHSALLPCLGEHEVYERINFSQPQNYNGLVTHSANRTVWAHSAFVGRRQASGGRFGVLKILEPL